MATGPISGPVSAALGGFPRGLSRLEHPGVGVGEWGSGEEEGGVWIRGRSLGLSEGRHSSFREAIVAIKELLKKQKNS